MKHHALWILTESFPPSPPPLFFFVLIARQGARKHPQKVLPLWHSPAVRRLWDNLRAAATIWDAGFGKFLPQWSSFAWGNVFSLTRWYHLQNTANLKALFMPKAGFTLHLLQAHIQKAAGGKPRGALSSCIAPRFQPDDENTHRIHEKYTQLLPVRTSKHLLSTKEQLDRKWAGQSLDQSSFCTSCLALWDAVEVG